MGEGHMLSHQTLNKLTEIICTDIGSKILSGASYVLVRDNQKAKIQRYMQVRRDIDAEGFGVDEVMKVYSVCNGCVFDIDMDTAKMITMSICNVVSISNPNIKSLSQMIETRPHESKINAQEKLAQYCIKKYKNNNRTIEVALYSCNNSNKIIINAHSDSNDDGLIKYNAYPLRVEDIQEVNEKYLIQNGLRISSIEPCEIIGNSSGLRVILTLSSRERKRA